MGPGRGCVESALLEVYHICVCLCCTLMEVEAMTSSTIHIRVDDETKAKAVRVLEAMGLDVSTAVRIYLVRIAAEQRLPFELRVPNAVTQEAISELEGGRAHRAENVNDLLDQLNADD